MEYQIVLTREGKKWTAEVPALPGCITWGATRGESPEPSEIGATFAPKRGAGQGTRGMTAHKHLGAAFQDYDAA